MVGVAEAMWWVLEELELKQALRFSFGLGLCKIKIMTVKYKVKNGYSIQRPNQMLSYQR